MCTATWWRSDDSFELLFNRDEQIIRPRAKPPRRYRQNDVSYLAPVDPQGGGHWIAVNERGLALALLNFHPVVARSTRPPMTSRGMIVKELVDAADTAALRRRLDRRPLAGFACFLLLALVPGKPVSVSQWDGRRLEQGEREDANPILTTSSYRSAEVEEARRARFAEAFQGSPASAERLGAFHRQHDLAQASHSVLMQREDALTVSISRIKVSAAEIRFTYQDRTAEEPEFTAPLEATLEPRLLLRP